MNAVERLTEWINQQCFIHEKLAKETDDLEIGVAHTVAAQTLEKLYNDIGRGIPFKEWEGDLTYTDHILGIEGLDRIKSREHESAFRQLIADEFLELNTEDPIEAATALYEGILYNVEWWDIWALWLMSSRILDLCEKESRDRKWQANQECAHNSAALPKPSFAPPTPPQPRQPPMAGLVGLAQTNARTLIDQILPTGVRLGSANRHQLQDARIHYAKDTIASLQKAYWIKFIEAELRDTQTVGEVLTDENLHQFLKDAATKAANCLASPNVQIKPLLLESQS